MHKVKITDLVQIAQRAGNLILDIYHHKSYEISHKLDQSPLTEADMASHQFICQQLKNLYPTIPIISEESNESFSFTERQQWEYFFLVDPLDGTKEFIKRNGEFTVNIALIKNNQPILGVIHAPVLNLTYYAEKNRGAYKIQHGIATKLFPTKPQQPLRVVVSRSHACEKTLNFIESLEKNGNQVVTMSIGSALKFGLVAEGNADIYPRFSPTMEWDTAAGHILVLEAGKHVSSDSHPLLYNKIELRNDEFIVQ
jgi:3'(2'), 5'-bisphosphate nucleotidase